MSEKRSAAEEILAGRAVFGKSARGRIGEHVLCRVDGKTVAEHRPKGTRTRPATEREAVNAALQERIKQAYDALDPKHVAAWRSYASTLRKPRRKSEGGGWKEPQPFQLFRKAMGERWREDPNAPVVRYPFEPTVPAWHGDGI